MRILQVLPTLVKGGAERVVIDLSNSLSDIGNEVTVLLSYPVDPRLNQKNIQDKVTIQFISSKKINRISMYANLPIWILRNWNDIKHYDVIHCHLTFGLFFGFLISLIGKFSRKKRMKIIGTGHSVAMNVDPFRKLLFRQVSKYFDNFILVNSQDSEWEKFISRKRISNIEVIPNGIANNLRIPVPANSTDREIWVIGTISRLEPERQPWSFLEVFAKINVLAPDRCRFILAGEGSAKDELKKLAKRAGIHERISMPGLIYDSSLVLSELDIYIALNMDGHTGIAGLEAVLAGIPVVGIQLSPTYLDGEVDWIWSNQDTTAVAQKIVEYIENPHNLSAVIALQHSKVFDEYSVRLMMENYLKIYKKK